MDIRDLDREAEYLLQDIMSFNEDPDSYDEEYMEMVRDSYKCICELIREYHSQNNSNGE